MKTSHLILFFNILITSLFATAELVPQLEGAEILKDATAIRNSYPGVSDKAIADAVAGTSAEICRFSALDNKAKRPYNRALLDFKKGIWTVRIEDSTNGIQWQAQESINAQLKELPPLQKMGSGGCGSKSGVLAYPNEEYYICVDGEQTYEISAQKSYDVSVFNKYDKNGPRYLQFIVLKYVRTPSTSDVGVLLTTLKGDCALNHIGISIR